MRAKLEKRIKFYRFCLASETAATLESIGGKLSQMDTGMRVLIISVRSDVKVSVLLEAFEPVLAVAEEIIPHIDGLKENQQLLKDARKAFGIHVLYSHMNRLVTKNTESVYYLIMGKMFLEGVEVSVLLSMRHLLRK